MSRLFPAVCLVLVIVASAVNAEDVPSSEEEVSYSGDFPEHEGGVTASDHPDSYIYPADCADLIDFECADRDYDFYEYSGDGVSETSAPYLLSTHASDEVEEAFRQLSQIRCDGQSFQVRLTAEEPCIGIDQVAPCPSGRPLRHIDSFTAVATCQPLLLEFIEPTSCLQIDDANIVCQRDLEVSCSAFDGLSNYTAFGLSVCECLETYYYVPDYQRCYRPHCRGPCACDELLTLTGGSVNASCVADFQVDHISSPSPARPAHALCLLGSRSASRGLCPEEIDALPEEDTEVPPEDGYEDLPVV